MPAMTTTSQQGVVELNVGGILYHTSAVTLQRHQSIFSEWFAENQQSTNTTTGLIKDRNGRYFIDRDGEIFRYILEYIRNGKLISQLTNTERQRLQTEAEYYKMPALIAVKGIASATAPYINSYERQQSNGTTTKKSGFITIGYQGTFSFGKGIGATEINFRKISRILVCGRVALCREVFGDTLNEGRDPDRGQDNRYTTRFYLKHTFIEQAFDVLGENEFKLVGSTASNTNSLSELKPGSSMDEERWAHYNQFIFFKG